MLINPEADQAEVERVIRELGLDKPVSEQYWYFLTNALKGDLGSSFIYNEPALKLILQRMPATLELALFSLFISLIIAIPLGIIAGVNQNRFLDRFLQLISYTGQGFPSFITALSLLFLAQNLSPLLPVGGMQSIDYDELSFVGKVLDMGWHMSLPTIA